MGAGRARDHGGVSTGIALVALVSWLATAFVGFVLADRWVTAGGRPDAAGEAPEPKIGAKRGITLGAHIGPAATSLMIWGAYVLVGGAALAWSAVVVLAAGVAFGVVLFTLGHRRRARARRPMPRPVAAHAVLACVTLALALVSLVA
jgi:hypothetical protein